MLVNYLGNIKEQSYSIFFQQGADDGAAYTSMLTVS